MQVMRDLRNPQQRRGFTTFEEYIQLDLDILEEIGMIRKLRNRNSSNFHQVEWEAVTGSPQQLDAAWKQYTKLGINSPIGRGLYSIQIQQLLQAMKRYHKSREADLMVIPSEDFRANPHAIHQRVLTFLELQPHSLDTYGVNIHSTAYRSQTMNPKRRQRLKQMFARYNRQLASLLGQDWQ
jgi:hypothetical protein